MKQLAMSVLSIAMLIALLPAIPAEAQFPGLTLPPGGDNQRSVVTQYMGLASVTVDYNSPDVHAPNGDDRTGKIWGGLVPYGMPNLGFGTCEECPWRVGANQNTTITLSHDVEVQGEALAKGTYGLHMAPGEEEWTIIFSRNSTAWGSFFYDPSEDALRVTAKPEKAEYREWLAFDFVDRQLDSTTVALHWENLRVPFTISLPDMVGLYVDNISNQLQNSQGFTWQSWSTAAQFVIQRDAEGAHLEQALEWADTAINAPFGIGQKNFTTLSTRAQVLAKMDQPDEAKAAMAAALEDPAVTPFQIHGYGRQLLGQGDKAEALAVFEKNAKLFPDTWPVNVGLARGHSAVGDYAKALEHAKIALGQAPNDQSRQNVEGLIKTLEEGKDIN